MAVEIERRFLVRGQSWRRHSLWQCQLQQGYLVGGHDGLVVRVRTSRPLLAAAGSGKAAPPPAGGVVEGQAWLTLKLPHGEPEAAALSRLEFEYAIPLADAEALLARCGRRVVKQRHGLDLPGGDWVLDVFEGANAPLVVAEVELGHPDQPVQAPGWCVRELTGRHELSNAALALNPLADWEAEARSALLGEALHD